MCNLNIPESGSIIVFDRVPNGSYASVGVPYLATIQGAGKGATIFLRNLKTGSGTFDRAAVYKFAIWHAATDKASACENAQIADDHFQRQLNAQSIDRYSDKRKWPAAVMDAYRAKCAADAIMSQAFKAA
ncbi:hypothetical protein [Rhizobium azibense]|uniref:Uncharacterized protein n=1 Tax=Rhizobium azibense TaxID=1136135 RepID=A0A4V2VDV1_9HYPH|nr:hypothetical protein [Rhizobium azibense]TCU34105.1 hypothetical protein EV129_11388 [Rhizobium azibense]